METTFKAPRPLPGYTVAQDEGLADAPQDNDAHPVRGQYQIRNDRLHDQQLHRGAQAINEQTLHSLRPSPPGGMPEQPKRKPTLPKPVRPLPETRTMTMQETISPELQAKIDALPDENLRANILRVLSGPGNRTLSREKIFENMVQNHAEVMAQRAQWRQWRDDEVLTFIERFKQEAPSDYADFMRQEHENNEIDDDTWWRTERLAERIFGELSGVDRSSLLGKVRDHFRALMK